MAKRSRKQTAATRQAKPDEVKAGSPQVSAVLSANERSFFFSRRVFAGDVISVLALYAVTLILFWSFVTQNTRFSVGGDSLAARAWNDVGAEIDRQVDGPAAWNPYVFIGFPTFGSLAYHPESWLNPANWLDAPGRYLFGTNKLDQQVFYYFLSGLLMYLFARGAGLPWWAGLLAGLTFLLNPYNISLAEAGHGSKQWTITMMPLAMLLTHRVLDRRRLLDLALLALGTAGLMLSLHAQVAYYALLLGGSYALVWFIGKLPRNRPAALRGFGAWAGGSLLGAGISAFVYWPVFLFSKYSIRGIGPLRDTGGGSGLDWDYATSWSLHPLESLQFLVPGWFGLGGSLPPDNHLSLDTALNYNLYWGWMPFTTSSLYMGIIPTLLAILAAVWLWRRDGVVRWMGLSALIAWIVSFGRFFPVLYSPLYHFLPFFDKFRVPSMALVITALGVSLLAAYGLAELVERLIRARDDDGVRRKLTILFTAILCVAAAGFAYAVLVHGPMDTFARPEEVSRYDADTLQLVLQLRWKIFAATLLATAVTLGVFSVTARLALKRNWVWMLPMTISAAVVFTTYDLMTLDQRFLHPVPERALEVQLAADPTVRFLQQQRDESPDPFRIFPVDDFQSNYWMYQRVASIGGYGANKLRVYQDLLDYALFGEQGTPNLNIAGMMNARYIVTSRKLPESFPLVFSDGGSKNRVYLNPLAMPRAWFVDEVEVVSNPDEAMGRIADRSFDPAETAIVTAPVEFQPAPRDSTRRAIVPSGTYDPQDFSIATSADQPGFLVLSEVWYPQGWYAELDGKTVEFVRTDYALRGLPLPAGQHTIRVWYRPPEITAGYAVSQVSLGVTIVLLAFSLIRLNTRRRTAGEAAGD